VDLPSLYHHLSNSGFRQQATEVIVEVELPLVNVNVPVVSAARNLDKLGISDIPLLIAEFQTVLLPKNVPETDTSVELSLPAPSGPGCSGPNASQT
jgi:hypothetical protein